MAYKAAFAFKVSKMVSINNTSAPPSTKPFTCSSYAVTSSSKVMALYPGSFTLGESESVRLVGPMDPATNFGIEAYSGNS